MLELIYHQNLIHLTGSWKEDNTERLQFSKIGNSPFSSGPVWDDVMASSRAVKDEKLFPLYCFRLSLLSNSGKLPPFLIHFAFGITLPRNLKRKVSDCCGVTYRKET